MSRRSLHRACALALALALSACAGAPARAPEFDSNPAASGFDVAGSDPRAVAIADQVMAAMGGRRAWDSARVLQWTFFGRRRWIWDRSSGDVRLDEGERTVQMNVATGRGRVFERGVEITDAARVAKILEGTRRAWINDSYWLVMPYKLKDSGVTLGWGGEERLGDGRAADVLVLTFERVGVTPQNRYEVLVSRDRHLVEAWRYFEKRSDAQPALETPWEDWRRYGPILLSGGRGERRLEGIDVLAEPPPELHEAPKGGATEP
jgi:hypothetical protein